MTEEIINVEELKRFLLELEKVIDCKNGTIETLKQENRELKAYKDVNEDFKKAWDELNEKYKQLRSALEEIREICKRAISLYKEEQNGYKQPDGISTWKNSQFEKTLNITNEVLGC